MKKLELVPILKIHNSDIICRNLLLLLVLLLQLLNCKIQTKTDLSPLEFELSSIQENESLSNLKDMKFKNFSVDWRYEHQYNYNCFSYLVSPIVDTLNVVYTIDLCYDKYKSWKKHSKASHAFKEYQNCLDPMDSYILFDETLDNITSNFYRSNKSYEVYYLSCDNEFNNVFQKVNFRINFDYFEELGEFAKDNMNVFGFYTTANGTNVFIIEEADPLSFTNFKYSIYGKDKNHIFDSRHGIIRGADLDSFKAIIKDSLRFISSIGQDKNQYYFWDEIIKDEFEVQSLLNKK